MSVFLIKAATSAVGMVCLVYLAYKTYTGMREETAQHQVPRTSPSRCPMCLKDFFNFSEKILLPCGHRMHRKCAECLFVQKENSCPECRKRISPEFLEQEIMNYVNRCE